MKSNFNEQDFATYTYKGTSSISGQAFLKTRGGAVRYAAGDAVYITPATSYTREIAQFLEDNDRDTTIVQGGPPEKSQQLARYVRKTTADGSGNFAFNGLTDGYYYVECGIYWMAGSRSTGSTVRKLYQIGAGQQARVILTE
jgi:hypothetical protein